MLQCILSDRLYVPEEYVLERHLAHFIYKLDDDDDEDYGPFSTSVHTIKTFNKVRLGDGNVYYGFSRGNLHKLGELFGDLPWDDRTAAPQMTSNLQFTGKLMNWEAHGKGQIEAAREWLQYKYGIIRAAPRFGKTVTGIALLTKLRLKTLIITHQKDLLEQFYNTFLKHTNIEAIWDSYGEAYYKKLKRRDATNQVVGYFQDYDNPEQLDVCFLCWQTFAAKGKARTKEGQERGLTSGQERLEKFVNSWGFVIVDEVHKTGGLCYSSTVNKLAAKYRLGLTGTVERTDGKEFIIKDVIGPVLAEGRSRQIPCKVKVINTGIAVKFKMSEPFVYLHKRLYASRQRMDLILQYLERDIRDGRWICFAFHSYSVAQLDQWVDRLKMLGHRAAAFHGKVPNREQILEDTRDGKIQVLVSNARMLTGIDVPRWDCYYSAFPSGNVVFNEQGKVSGNFYQEYSRIRTLWTNAEGKVKDHAVIRDFVDSNGICYGMFKKRLAAYEYEKFPIETISHGTSAMSRADAKKLQQQEEELFDE